MYEPGLEKEQLKVWLDVPGELQAALDGGMEMIGSDCLKNNAEIVLGLFEEINIKHVLGHQIKDKTLGRIIRGNPDLENDLGTTPEAEVLAGKIAKSSLLGQDPWGDKPLPLAPIPEEGASEDAQRIYTEKQTLLKTVQDQTWLYLTTHLKRIVGPEILRHIINEELKYKHDEDQIRTNQARNRMPWGAYRSIVVDLLPDDIGMYELKTLMALCREDGETASRWIQRLRIGKQLVGAKHIILPEEIYVDMALRYLTRQEIKTMAVKITKKRNHSEFTTSQAKAALSKQN